MAPENGRAATAVAVASGVLGLLSALALEADLLFEAGVWYPVVYAGAPTVAATAAFAHERPGADPPRLAGVAAWVLAGSVLALAAAVVLSLGFPAETPRSPVATVLGAGLLYAGFLLVPVGLAVAAARRRGARSALALALSPVGQVLVAAVVILP